MKKKILMLVSLATVAGGALADESLKDYVSSACSTELKEFCSTVTPGEGRLLSCAAAHSDKLSDQCAGALVNASMILADMTDQVLATADACETELVAFCGDVEVGEGRVLQCLDDHDDELGEVCEDALDALLDE